MSLLTRTQVLLQRRMNGEESLRQIAAMSGGAVDYEWLVKFASGKVKDPGVNRVQALHDFLAKSKAA